MISTTKLVDLHYFLPLSFSLLPTYLSTRAAAAGSAAAHPLDFSSMSDICMSDWEAPVGDPSR